MIHAIKNVDRSRERLERLLYYYNVDGVGRIALSHLLVGLRVCEKSRRDMR